MKKLAVIIIAVFVLLISKSTIAQNPIPIDESAQMPILKIGNMQNRMPAVMLKMAKEVTADLQHLNIDTEYKVEKFTILIVRVADNTLVKTEITGNKISQEAEQFFKTVAPGDYVIFKDIYVSSAKRPSFKTQDTVIYLK